MAAHIPGFDPRFIAAMTSGCFPRLNRFDLSLQFPPRHLQIVSRLNAEPKLSRAAEVAGEPEGGVRGDWRLLAHKALDPSARHMARRR
jgi:hypothetical protein